MADSFYTKIKWEVGVIALKLEVISKLRCDADLDYVYLGVQIRCSKKEDISKIHHPEEQE